MLPLAAAITSAILLTTDDACGAFHILQGTGLMDRVQTVEMETTRDDCPLLYEAKGREPYCSHMMQQMRTVDPSQFS